MLDIDDTLIDYTGAEIVASTEFGKQFASMIPDYNITTFSEKWHYYMDKYFGEFLIGKLSYSDQRRYRIRAIFQDETLNDDEIDKIFAVYKEIYERNWKLFDDVLPFLEKYKHEGFIAISDGQQSQQERKLTTMGIIKYFKKVVTAEIAKSQKPNIEIFQIAMKSININPEQCIYIGDNIEKDALGANKAGMTGIWLNRKNVKINHNLIEIKSLYDFKPCFLKTTLT
jgi:putative hydrolase of the HAD superfamily